MTFAQIRQYVKGLCEQVFNKSKEYADSKAPQLLTAEELDEIVYKIPQTSAASGTEVTANPSDSATAELSKIQIDSVIYSIVTKAVDDLTNYYTKTNTYTKSEVDALITAIKNSRFEVVSSLPTEDIKTNVIYLVPSSDPKTNNVKDEYINPQGTTSGWELIGSTSIDLSGYVTTAALNSILAGYVTTAALNTALTAYMTTTAFNTAIASYYTKTEVDNITGDLSDLQTSTKTNLVAAINEAAQSGGNNSSSAQYTAGNGINISNSNEISIDPMTSADMDDVVTPLPGVASRLPRYSTEEQIVGYWIDGKPIYQKTMDAGSNITIISTGWTQTSFQASNNIDTIIQAVGTNGTACCPLLAINDYSGSGFWKFEASRNENSIVIRWFTVQYTKTTN